MQDRHWWQRTGAAIGLVLVVGTIAVGAGQPVYGNDNSGKAQSFATDLKQEQRDLAQLKADSHRLTTEMEKTMAAAAPTSGVVPAGADEVSAATAALFNSYAQEYQALSQQAAAFHREFVQALAKDGSQLTPAQAAAATPYAAWLATSATQAEQAAAQASAAARQFEQPQTGPGGQAGSGG